MADTKTSPLEHLQGCPAKRTETYRNEGAVTTRCQDCGAHHVEKVTHRIEPGSDEFVEAWQQDPRSIRNGLTAEERRDPSVNPMHPFADPWPPGHAPKAPTIHPPQAGSRRTR